MIRNIFLVLLSSFTSFSYVYANQPQAIEMAWTDIGEEHAKCSDILASPGMFFANIKRISLGSTNEIHTLLMSSGTSTEGANLIMNVLGEILDNKSGIFPDFFKIEQSTQTPLCMGASPCRLNSTVFAPTPSPFPGEVPTAEAGYVLTPSNFLIAKLEGASPNFMTISREKRTSLATNGLRSNAAIFARSIDPIKIAGTRVVPNGNSAAVHLNKEGVIRLAIWFGQLFREMSKSSLTHILSNWVKANFIKINSGGQPDFLFKKYAGVSNQGDLIISSDYYFFLVHAVSASAWTRAEGAITSLFLGQHPNIKRFLDLQEAGHRSGAYKDLKKQISPQALDELDITVENIFEQGELHLQALQIVNSSEFN